MKIFICGQIMQEASPIRPSAVMSILWRLFCAGVMKKDIVRITWSVWSFQNRMRFLRHRCCRKKWIRWMPVLIKRHWKGSGIIAWSIWCLTVVCGPRKWSGRIFYSVRKSVPVTHNSILQLLICAAAVTWNFSGWWWVIPTMASLRSTVLWQHSIKCWACRSAIWIRYFSAYSVRHCFLSFEGRNLSLWMLF